MLPSTFFLCNIYIFFKLPLVTFKLCLLYTGYCQSSSQKTKQKTCKIFERIMALWFLACELWNQFPLRTAPIIYIVVISKLTSALLLLIQIEYTDPPELNWDVTCSFLAKALWLPVLCCINNCYFNITIQNHANLKASEKLLKREQQKWCSIICRIRATRTTADYW